MGIIKYLLGFIIAGRFLYIIAFFLIAMGAFFIFSDADFVTNSVTKVTIILDNISGNFVNWVVDYIQKIKGLL